MSSKNHYKQVMFCSPFMYSLTNVKRFVTNFSRGVFGRARRYLDWLRCAALCCILLSASYCVVLCCDVMCCDLCLTCYSSLLA